MRKQLTKIKKYSLYHTKDGVKIEGKNIDMRGNCSYLEGDCTNLRGDCSYLEGDCTNLRGDCSCLEGDCTNLRGDCTGLSGDLNDCEITDDERAKGIDINDLIK